MNETAPLIIACEHLRAGTLMRYWELPAELVTLRYCAACTAALAGELAAWNATYGAITDRLILKGVMRR